MSAITEYRCVLDGTIFEDLEKYQEHLRKHVSDYLGDKKVYITKEFWENEFWNKVKSLDQLRIALLKHAETIGLNGIVNERFYRNKRPETPPILKKISIFEFNYNRVTSNTHSCPHNGVTNWRGCPEIPRGYPGFEGRIVYYVEWYSKWQKLCPGGSNMWKNTRIYTESGGYIGFNSYDLKNKNSKGLQNFVYDVKIFLDDWPAMKEAFLKAQTLCILEHGPNVSMHIVIDKMNELYPGEDYR